jgi:hypothetical protein
MRKGQAALEFLMTYGWAILVVLILSAALMSLGVINIRDKLPEQAKFPAPFNAEEFAIDKEGNISIQFYNALNDPITISQAVGSYSGTDYCQNLQFFTSDKWQVGPKETFTLKYSCPDGAGKRVLTYLTFTYNISANNLPHTHTGYVTVNG